MNKRQKKKLLKKKLKSFGCEVSVMPMRNHRFYDMVAMVKAFADMIESGNNRTELQLHACKAHPKDLEIDGLASVGSLKEEEKVSFGMRAISNDKNNIALPKFIGVDLVPSKDLK